MQDVNYEMKKEGEGREEEEGQRGGDKEKGCERNG